ncbi:hypothetical protein ZWY2020_047500 [Hordeum vulgare]|nr:hypothetical protein ZWY2020_047500 [Hordeum vulgare]
MPRSLDPSEANAFTTDHAPAAPRGKKKKEVKKETKLGMAYKKEDKFGEWYSEVHFLAYHSGLVRFIYKSIWAYGGLVGAM